MIHRKGNTINKLYSYSFKNSCYAINIIHVHVLKAEYCIGDKAQNIKFSIQLINKGKVHDRGK